MQGGFGHRVSAACNSRENCCCSCRAVSPACREPPAKPTPLLPQVLEGLLLRQAAAGRRYDRVLYVVRPTFCWS